MPMVGVGRTVRLQPNGFWPNQLPETLAVYSSSIRQVGISMRDELLRQPKKVVNDLAPKIVD